MAPPNISDISVSSSAREDFLCLVLLPVCCKDQSVKSNLTTNVLRAGYSDSQLTVRLVEQKKNMRLLLNSRVN